MPLLPYCIVDELEDVQPPEAGVRDAPIQELASGGLRCFYSELDGMPTAQTVREDALRFQEAINAVFSQTTVIPFRFVTLINSEDELEAFLKRRSKTFLEALERLSGTAQFEIRIAARERRDEVPAASGTEYLESRQQENTSFHSAVDALRSAAGDLALEWHVREGDDSTRCFVLVRRDSATAAREKMSKAELPAELRVVLSGPWPPSEFVERRTQEHE